ncbi:hypothetical protein LCGC14_1126490 [marine sediment metagenome]|uniref:Uncharacterized protein n=1 Tax=marine sediment metagenome TaxID=412755 RepID=A0A0F9PKI2_9ZZZZ
MMQCSCGAWDKIEEALERIQKKYTNVDGTIYGLAWTFGMGKSNANNLCVTNVGPLCTSPNEVMGVEKPCDLPAAIMKLRDKVDPPKPKEREWRVGDVVQSVSDVRYAPGTVAILTGPEKNHGGAVTNLPRGGTGNWFAPGNDWRNLTREAEQAGEDK